ncbi:hypothetical protein QCE73_00035 [Caballeronia sp. LZ029]|uniref:DUF5983 family protein n=1 Tax=Caballeronia sp. LZ029 TaxID=3038564 RepID=UPI0028654861|nr:hypothetical protein [Caballeronia sp. LZ029]MDR5741536.1 hypothetical protein [Caballeronia sp. LZ029]
MSEVTQIFNVDIIPAISTCHVSQETAEQLDLGDSENSWTIVAAYERGWFLYVQPEDLMSVSELGMPADLADVMAWGRRHKVQWVRMDCRHGLGHDASRRDVANDRLRIWAEAHLSRLF